MKLKNIPDCLHDRSCEVLYGNMALVNRLTREALEHEALAQKARKQAQSSREDAIAIVDWFIKNLDTETDRNGWFMGRLLAYKEALQKPEIKLEDTIIRTIDEILKDRDLYRNGAIIGPVV